MMGAKRFLSNRLMLAVGLAVAVLASALPAMAQGATGVIVDFPDSGVIEIKDLEGTPVGEGEHTGTVRCHAGNCGQKTELQIDSATITYRFKDVVVVAPALELAVVSGTGVISSEDGKARFRFVATLQNVGGGAVMVRYAASRPDASFILTAPGTLTLVERP